MTCADFEVLLDEQFGPAYSCATIALLTDHCRLRAAPAAQSGTSTACWPKPSACGANKLRMSI